MAISPQRLTIYLFSAHRAVIFAIAQLSCYTVALFSEAAEFGSQFATMTSGSVEFIHNPIWIDSLTAEHEEYDSCAIESAVTKSPSMFSMSSAADKMSEWNSHCTNRRIPLAANQLP